MSSVVWTGETGRLYRYQVCDLAKPWLDVPGNFILARATENVLTAIYIGQTASLRDRLPAYVEWEVARHAGATHLLAHVNFAGERPRVEETADLVRAYMPLLNQQHRAA
jgi:hypothetical protein